MERIIAPLLLLIALNLQAEPGRERLPQTFTGTGIHIDLENDPYWYSEERNYQGFSELQIETPEHYYPSLIMLFRVMHQPLPDPFSDSKLMNAALGAAETVGLSIQSVDQLQARTYPNMQGYQYQESMQENQVRLFMGRNTQGHLTMLMLVYRSDSEVAVNSLLERSFSSLRFVKPQP